MGSDLHRRDMLALMALGGGVVFASQLVGCARRLPDDFYFLQLSDTHWGYTGPNNPQSDMPLRQAVAQINALSRKPDFVVFTGDLTHTTDDATERQRRMAEFRQIASGLMVPQVRFLPGEHDAAADAGAAYQQNFGPLHYSFDYKGVHFVALDNVSDPHAAIGDAQLDWLRRDLAPLAADAPIVVLAHRPLFDLYPQWDWSTSDGSRVIDLLSQYRNVTVFYGHIHQVDRHTTANITHYGASSLMWAFPPAGSQPMKAPVPWDPAHPDAGLGYRTVGPDDARAGFALTELPLVQP